MPNQLLCENTEECSPNIDYKVSPQNIMDLYSFQTTEAQLNIFDALKDIPRIKELDEPDFSVVNCAYEEGTVEEVLYPVVEAHNVIMVAGGFFGDEGKGKTIDAVARHPKCSIIARTNSGENAGHTVINQQTKEKFVFHLAPSGLLLENKKNYVGPECVMDPISFFENELQQLTKAGISYKDRLFIGNVFIVTPYHKLIDMLTSLPNSSTLKGMSPSHASKVTKRGIRLDHLFNDQEVVRRRLERDMETYLSMLKYRGMSDEDVLKRIKMENSDGVKRVPDYCADFAIAEDKVSFLVDLYNKWVVNNPEFPQRIDVPAEIRRALGNGEKILLEGPQSYWLSNCRDKFWESSTSADTSAAGMLATAQINFCKCKAVVINVHKTPGTSRIGIGANPSAYVPQDFFSSQEIRTLEDLPQNMCEDFISIQREWVNAVQPNGIVKPVEYFDHLADRKCSINVALAIASSKHHGEFGATTLKPRICGVFDCVSFFEVNDVQGPYVTISALDRGDDYEKVGITIAYVYYSKTGDVISSNGRPYHNGDIIRAGDPYPSEAVLYNCYPIIKLIDGWKSEGKKLFAGTRKPFEPLPHGVQQIIATIEHFTKATVISIGNGPRGDDIIYLKRPTA